MRVAVVTTGLPHPTRGASTVLFFQYLAALRAAGHVIYHAVLTGGRDVSATDIAEYRAAMRFDGESKLAIFDRPPVFEAHRLVIRRRKEGLAAIRQEIERFRSDAIVCFDLDAAAVAAPMACGLKTIWLGDLTFQSTWYNYLYGMREDPRTLRWLPYAVAQRHGWRKVYADTLHSFAPIIVSSKSSEGELRNLGLTATYKAYPWPAPAPAPARRLPGHPTFLFFGNLTGLGSRSAFHFMFSKVVPLLRRVWPDRKFRILIAGNLMREWAMERIKDTPELEFVGFVDDLGELVSRCHAVLAPLDVPVGNRSRIVTAMALGALVIAHRNTTLGNPSIVNGENALLFETADEMAALMRAAVDDPQRFAPLKAEARNSYLREFEPSVAAGLFAHIVERRGIHSHVAA